MIVPSSTLTPGTRVTGLVEPSVATSPGDWLLPSAPTGFGLEPYNELGYGA